MKNNEIIEAFNAGPMPEPENLEYFEIAWCCEKGGEPKV